MKRRFLPMKHDDSERFDLLIAAIGFESRSTHVALNSRASRRVFFPYADQSSLTFARAARVAAELRQSEMLYATGLIQFESQLDAVLSTIDDGARIAVDISSFDRRRLAIILDSLHRLGESLSELTFDILYAPAAYAPPEDNLIGSPLEAGPVGGKFQGHLRRTSLPLAAVFGLGYEPQRAIGAFELLEPSRAWAFLPESDDERYAASLGEANRLLLSLFTPRDVLAYPVLDPGETFYRLESLVASLSRSNRVVLVPMGPKIFAACCLLLGLDTAPDRPAVWRIGVAGGAPSIDVKARGEIVGLRVELESETLLGQGESTSR